MTFGSLFAGIGGMDLGLERAGMECRWQVEIDPFCRRVLEKHWPHVKRYEDVRSVSGLEPVDLIAGGFPCQDISNAGNGVGIIGARSGLWKEFARILEEVRPRLALIENVPALRSKGLALVLRDLWSLGYDAEWHCIPACAFGAHHERDRIWIISYTAGMFREAIIRGKPNGFVQGISDFGWTAVPANDEGDGCGSRWQGGPDSSAARQQPEASPDADVDGEHGYVGGHRTGEICGQRPAPADVPAGEAHAYPDGEPLVGAAIARGERHAWTVEPGVVRMVHGIPRRVDRLRTLGNCVVPQIPEWIGRRIMEAAA